jgi:hypothetical protein
VLRGAFSLLLCLYAPLAFAAGYYPTVGTITPSSGQSSPEQAVSFTTTYSNPQGYTNIQYVYFLVNVSSALGTNCFWGYYNQSQNKFYLRDNTNKTWLGGFKPGSPFTVGNSYAKLNCSKSSVSGLDNTLTVQWNIIFRANFTGYKRMYLYVANNSRASSGWQQRGEWFIQPDSTPPTGSILINNNDIYASSRNVTLSLSAQDNPNGSGVSQVQLSNDNRSWSTPEKYSPTKSWALTSGDGTKTVYVRFRDFSSNWSQVYADTIILDATIPVITQINPQDKSTLAQNTPVPISVIVNGGGPSSLEYQFSLDGVIQQAWSAQTTYTWLNPYLGQHSLKVEVRDIAGQSAKEAEVYVLHKPLNVPE